MMHGCEFLKKTEQVITQDVGGRESAEGAMALGGILSRGGGWSKCGAGHWVRTTRVVRAGVDLFPEPEVHGRGKVLGVGSSGGQAAGARGGRGGVKAGCRSEGPLRRCPEGHELGKNCKLGKAGRGVPFRRSHIVCVRVCKVTAGCPEET